MPLVRILAVLFVLGCLISAAFGERAATDAPTVDVAALPAYDASTGSVSSTTKDNILNAIEKEGAARSWLEKKLVRELKAVIPGNDHDLILDQVRLPLHLELPDAPWEVEFEFRPPQRGVGTAVFTGIILIDGKPTDRFTGSVEVDRRASGVQVSRLVRRGERIGPGDLLQLEARLSRLPPDALTSLDELEGVAAKREIRPGVWLTGRMLEMPKIVKSRQVVTMFLNNGPIQIHCNGVAKERGAIGDVIRVENVHSGREVSARILSKDEVEVVF